MRLNKLLIYRMSELRAVLLLLSFTAYSDGKVIANVDEAEVWEIKENQTKQVKEEENYIFNFHGNEGYACVVRFKPRNSTFECCYMRENIFGDGDASYRKYLCTEAEAARSGCRRRGDYTVEDGIGDVCELKLKHLKESDLGEYVAIMPVGESKHHAISLHMEPQHNSEPNVSLVVGLSVGFATLLSSIFVAALFWVLKKQKRASKSELNDALPNHNISLKNLAEETGNEQPELIKTNENNTTVNTQGQGRFVKPDTGPTAQDFNSVSQNQGNVTRILTSIRILSPECNHMCKHINVNLEGSAAQMKDSYSGTYKRMNDELPYGLQVYYWNTYMTQLFT